MLSNVWFRIYCGIVVPIGEDKAVRMLNMSLAAPDKVCVTFASGKHSLQPSPYIEDPIDISESIGEIYDFDCNILKRW